MLSRLAESLFWIGRYVERAEDTARILDVHLHLLLEDRWVDEGAACRNLLDVMGSPDDIPAEDCTVRTVTELLGTDPDTHNSIVGALRGARENARGARDAISSEMWESLNASYHALPDMAELAGVGPHTLFRYVKERTAVVAGLADSTMTRDDGWHFLILGRSLERVDMTARLLSARYGELWGPTGWVSTLRSCGAHEAYLRSHQRAVDATDAAAFLLLDRLFPRSIFHALGTAEQAVRLLHPEAAREGAEDRARRILGRARADLEFRTAEHLLDDLPDTLRHLQEACHDAGQAIGERYFRQARVMTWSA